MTEEIAYKILCEQIEGMKKQISAEKEQTGQLNEKVWGLTCAMMEGAKQLHLDLNCRAAAELAAENVAKKNFKLIDRSMAIDALRRIPANYFDFKTVCKVLRKLEHLDFKTEYGLKTFASTVEQYNELQRASLKQAAEEVVDVADLVETVEADEAAAVEEINDTIIS